MSLIVSSLWKGDFYLRQTMRELAEIVAERSGVSLDEMKTRDLSRRVSHARQWGMALQKADGYSSAQIARFWGLKDHTTVLHGVRAHHKRVAA